MFERFFAFQVGFNENCFIELKSLKVDESMEKVGKYHLFVITRKKQQQTYFKAVIFLEGMTFIDDPKNFVLLRRDLSPDTPAANILTTGVTGNTILRQTMTDLLELDKDTLTIVILTSNFEGHLGQLLTDEGHKLTLAKMETLKTYAIDSVVLGGTKAFQPKNLIEKFRASIPKRLHIYQGPVSMARCGIKLEAFYTQGFMADKSSPGYVLIIKIYQF